MVLKSLTNSQNVTLEFLNETINTKLVDSSGNVVECYGISQDPETKNYVMVMQYMEGGNLREYLKDNYSKLYFFDKLSQLRDIAKGLNSIHQKELVHRDFHTGNILNKVVSNNVLCRITDLGLSKPVNEADNKVFGVLPYVAPEVLREKGYTKVSDIYSFGIIAWEILSGLPPYHEFAHEENLAITNSFPFNSV